MGESLILEFFFFFLTGNYDHSFFLRGYVDTLNSNNNHNNKNDNEHVSCFSPIEAYNSTRSLQ